MDLDINIYYPKTKVMVVSGLDQFTPHTRTLSLEKGYDLIYLCASISNTSLCKKTISRCICRNIISHNINW